MAWPSTLVSTGDLITAPQLNQLPIALAEANGAAASYSFTSIPAFWTHLSIIAYLQTASGNAQDDLTFQLNGNAGNNYYSEYLRAAGGTASANEDLTKTQGYCGSVPGTTNGGFASVLIWIPNYTVSGRKSVQSTCYCPANTSTGTLRVEQRGSLWTQSGAINRVDLIPAAGSFLANSIATLYGWGAI